MTESKTPDGRFDPINSDLLERLTLAAGGPEGLSAAAQALLLDGQGDWSGAHDLINKMETPDAMAVHAYLHRQEGDAWNADYWYRRAGRRRFNGTLEQEWQSLVVELLAC